MKARSYILRCDGVEMTASENHDCFVFCSLVVEGWNRPGEHATKSDERKALGRLALLDREDRKAVVRTPIWVISRILGSYLGYKIRCQ